jgi:hypothetical protein
MQVNVEAEDVAELLHRNGIETKEGEYFGRLVDKLRKYKWDSTKFNDEEKKIIEELGGKFWEKKKKWK